jgi:hypothetical protein
LEQAAILEAAGNVEQAREALRRYVAAEKNPLLRQQAETYLQRLDRAR